jgi:hypothetical protein
VRQLKGKSFLFFNALVFALEAEALLTVQPFQTFCGGFQARVPVPNPLVYYRLCTLANRRAVAPGLSQGLLKAKYETEYHVEEAVSLFGREHQVGKNVLPMKEPLYVEG